MTILRGIPRVLNPKLLYVLASMGHGDEIVLADANFPAASCAKHTTLGEEIRMDSTPIPELLAAIAALMPLDPVANAGIFMQMMPEHVAAGWKTPIWDTYKGIIVAANGPTQFEEVERMAVSAVFLLLAALLACLAP